MALEQMVKELKGYFKGKGKLRCDAIDDLLEQLAEKKKHLEKKIEKESGASKRKHLKLELKIVSAELEKGKQRRKEIKQRCK